MPAERTERYYDLPESLAELAEQLPLTLTKAEACHVLRMAPITFQRAVNRRELATIKCGPGASARVLVTRRELLRWLSERTLERVTWIRHRSRPLKVACGGRS